jgi:23S rRNA pseudouridine2604 synthase
MRLNKYIVQLGICSRRKADSLIESGSVLINGKKAPLGYQLNDGDQVEIDSKTYIFKNQDLEKYYLALNKPKGFITSFEENSKNLDQLLVESNFLGDKRDFKLLESVQLHYAGRLDKESSGLLILTNDGDFSYKLTHPKFGSEKEYLVETQKKLTNEQINKMRSGVTIDPEDDGNFVNTHPCFVEQISEKKLRIILSQGYKRQIRLMLKAVGNYVTELKRIRIANIALKEYKIFKGQQSNTPYTNMIVLDKLAEYKFCLIEQPQLANEHSNQ